MTKITDIETAIKKLQDLLEQMEPYRAYMAAECDNLDESIKLLKSPTKENIGTAVEKLSSVHQSLKAYESMAPAQVTPVLEMINEIIASLK